MTNILNKFFGVSQSKRKRTISEEFVRLSMAIPGIYPLLVGSEFEITDSKENIIARIRQRPMKWSAFRETYDAMIRVQEEEEEANNKTNKPSIPKRGRRR